MQRPHLDDFSLFRWGVGVAREGHHITPCPKSARRRASRTFKPCTLSYRRQHDVIVIGFHRLGTMAELDLDAPPRATKASPGWPISWTPCRPGARLLAEPGRRLADMVNELCRGHRD